MQPAKFLYKSLRNACLLISSAVALNAESILTVADTYRTGIYDKSASEIVAFDPLSKRVFVSNDNNNTLDVFRLEQNASLSKLFSLSMATHGAGVNAVAIKNGLVAVAVEANPKQNPGKVAIFSSVVEMNGTALTSVQVGALPDHLAFTNDGNTLVVANEGEPNDDYNNDPNGTISVISLVRNDFSVQASTVNLSFSAFDSRKEELKAKGVRIFGKDGNATVSQDLEPEYVAIKSDDSLAFVSLQENNAYAVVDIAAAKILDVIPFGYKDHARGRPSLKQYHLNELIATWPSLGKPETQTDPVMLGGFSGLWVEESNNTDEVVFWAVPDRGPNADNVDKSSVLHSSGSAPSQNIRPFKLPNYQGRIVKFRLNRSTGMVSLVRDVMLHWYNNGIKTPITGRGNVPGVDEVPVAFTSASFPGTDYTDSSGKTYHALPYDRYGGDFEGVLIADGSFWMCDEYRPAIYKFSMDGNLTARYVASGTAASDGNASTTPGFYGTETLPAVYGKRRANRGFEAIAYDKNNTIYAFIQTPMYNPDSSTKNASDVIRVLGINKTNGATVAEYVYLLENNRHSGHSLKRTDKIGDAVYVGKKTGDLRFLVMERDSSDPKDGKSGHKYIFEIDLRGATNLRASGAHTTIANDVNGTDGSKTLEQMTVDELVAAGIKPVFKQKILNMPSLGYLPSDKPEGLGILSDGTIALINDNDFGLSGAGVSDTTSFGLISFDKNAYSFDANNKDDVYKPFNWPTLGMYQPDSIATYDHNGTTYIVTANEGDAREYKGTPGYEEEARGKDLVLRFGNGIFENNSSLYPDPSDNLLASNKNLARLKTTTANGRIEDNATYDRFYSYGARSFSIWDEFGNQVFDSGNDFERITHDYNSSHFNASNDENDVDGRSDDKGPEPEGLTLGNFGDKVYAFIGLERVGGVMVYDVTDPFAPKFLDYVNNRNFGQAANTAAAGDLGPEGLVFVPAVDSPTGGPLLIVSNEVSGTTTVYRIGGKLPLVPVRNLVVRPAGNAIHLQWTDTNNQESGYRVFRKASDEATYLEVANLASNSTYWSDQNLTSGKSYSYRVDSYNTNFTVSTNDSGFFAPIKPVLSLLSTYNPVQEDYAEVPAFDPLTKRVFVSNNKEKRVDVMELDNAGKITFKFSLALPSGSGGINAVSVKNGVLAVAVEATVKQNVGKVVFYDTKSNGPSLASVTVGSLPDHLTFTPDGLKVVVANEGEPSDDYTNDPKGSISIIDVSKIDQFKLNPASTYALPVTTLDFTAFDANKSQLIAKGVRIFGNNGTASVSQDLEPEYVAVSADSTKAYVTLQENNALAFVDLVKPAITAIKPLGYKDYQALGLAFDANDKDGLYKPFPWPVLGMYQPDSIVSFKVMQDGPPVFKGLDASNPAQSGAEVNGSTKSYSTKSIATLSMTGAEISDYDPVNKMLYVVGGGTDLLTVDLANPGAPVLGTPIALGGTAQSVAVNSGFVAIALSNPTDKTQDGTVALYSVATPSSVASLVTTFQAGALPDSVAFSKDGNFIVVANEGEPNDAYTVDPDGSITVIRFNKKDPSNSVVHQLGFGSFSASQLTAAGVRLSGPNKANPSKDLEPEYVTISPDGKKAFVSLQENNGLAIVDLTGNTPVITSVVGAGVKDWSKDGLLVDTTDKDSGANFASADFRGLNMPDGMDSYVAGDGRTYFIAANEGDGREYEDNGNLSYSDENRSKDFNLTIGGGDRLKITTWDKNGDGAITSDERFAFGGRSFTIYDEQGTLVFDSGDLLDRKALEVGSYPDGRSDDKGSEPEGVEIATVNGRSIAFIAMERSSTVAVFDVTNPKNSVFLEMIKLNANLSSPEGLKFIPAEDSGNGKHLLVVSAEYLKGIEVIEISPPSVLDVFSSEFLITANEGDARDYGGYSEEKRVKDLTLDYNGTGLAQYRADYPDPAHSLNDSKQNLGRLKTTNANGDVDGDGKFEKIYSYGARSFSIWSAKDGSLVYDSGLELERIVQETYPNKFNIDDDDADGRSDDKGVEPEGLAVGEVDGRIYAFIGLERQSGIMVYDISDPLNPRFIEYVNNRDYSKAFNTKEAGDVGPEGLTFVSAADSPTGYPLLIVTNEVSGSTSIWGMQGLPVGPVKGLRVIQEADFVMLNWNDHSSLEKGFRIMRRTVGSNQFNEIGQVGRNVTRFFDVQTEPGKSYEYQIIAFNDVSQSMNSEIISTTANLRITILHSNDAEKLMPVLDASGGYYGGAALFVSKMKELRKEYGSLGHGILSISAGDNLMPGKELSASLGGQDLFHSMLMDQSGFDLATLGNHEFDAGPDVTAQFITSAKRPVFLSANLDFSKHNPTNKPSLDALFKAGRISKSALTDVSVGAATIKVGVVGATTKNLSFISSPAPVVVDLNVSGKVQTEIDALRQNGAKVIILSSHLQGVNEEISLLKELTGVDVVIAGGGDNRLANPSDTLIPGEVAEGPYPLVAVDKSGFSVPVVTVDGQLKYIGRLTLDVSAQGKVLGWQGGINRVVDTKIDPFRGVVGDRVAYETIERPVNEFVQGFAQSKISSPIGFSLNAEKNDIRAKETNLGNLIADSQLWAAKTVAASKGAPIADIAIANGGGIRSSINLAQKTGYEVTVEDTFNVLPFSNFVSVVPKLSSAELKLLLENAISKTVLEAGAPKRSGDGTGRFPQIAGFKLEYDINAKPMKISDKGEVTQQGVRVVNATLNDGTKIIENGIPVDNKTVNLAIVDFLAKKGDQYFNFRATEVPFTVLGYTYQAALAEYIKDKLKGDLSSYEKPDGRIKFDAKASSSGLKAGNAGIYFPGAVSKAAGWKELGWFGNYWDKEFPWVYHQGHGWLYAGGSGGASMWLYDLEMGWWWTNEQYYPFVYMNELKEWVYFRSNTNSVLRFFFRFNAQGGEWKTFPKSGQN